MLTHAYNLIRKLLFYEFTRIRFNKTKSSDDVCVKSNKEKEKKNERWFE